MKQLARTLLILGGVTACERAHPVVDPHDRPAVGNIGQTGRPEQRPGAIATPLADASGTPMVGNIGQTGAPAEQPRAHRQQRRVQRVQRVQRAAVSARPDVARPRVDQYGGPLVGNIMSKCGWNCVEAKSIRERLAFETEQIVRPLLTERERPAVANTMSKRTPRGPQQYLARLKAKIDETRGFLDSPRISAEQRAELQLALADMTATYQQLANEAGHR
jgi:hypothetical protein